MFFRRHRGGHGLLGLILALLGFKFAMHKCADQGDKEQRDAFRSKAKEFRSKMKEAFAVWREEPEAEPEAKAAPEAGASENQG
ncbi:MAG TPA: hypothetical protein VGK74_21970 [Symbiobacteriaceae bacterium]|jgi:hypothetical protein